MYNILSNIGHRLCLIILAVLTVSFPCLADTWTTFPNFDGKVTNIIPANDGHVYFVSGGSLFSIAGDGSENVHYNESNRLNNSSVDNIYYDYSTGTMVVTYSDCSLDIMRPDGKTIFVSDLREADLVYERKIYHVTFGNGNIYVGFTLGMAVVDEEKGNVKSVNIFFVGASRLTYVNGNLLALYNSKQHFYVNGDENLNHQEFIWLNDADFDNEVLLSDGRLLARDLKDKKAIKVTIPFNGPNLEKTYITGSPSLGSDFVCMADGNFCALTEDGKQLAVFDKNGDFSKLVGLPEVMQKKYVSARLGLSEVYYGGSAGVGAYDLSSGTGTVLKEPYRPEGISSPNIARLSLSGDRTSVFATTIGVTQVNPAGLEGEGISAHQTFDIIKDGRITYGLPDEFTLYTTPAIDAQKSAGDKRLYGGPGKVLDDPDVEGRYYICNSHEGIVVVEDGRHLLTFNQYNTPMRSVWDMRVTDVAVDPAGNLWVCFHANSTVPSGIIVLPKEKRLGDLTEVQSSDWKFIRMAENYLGNKDMQVFFDKSGIVLVSVSWYDTGFFFIDTRGTWDDDSDDIRLQVLDISDQDGNKCLPHQISYLYQEENGKIWIGMDRGLIVLPSLSKAMENRGEVLRIKVARNDGTNYADYLLDKEFVTGICEDPAGRKWISTNNSGLYLVSQNGDRIIKHFTESNSGLLSNQVFAVMSEPSSNRVYVSTSKGMQTYMSDATAPMQDYSEISAYPNPVRPDYDGPVNITGLMDNSLVKICDSAGNVIYQTKSEGGMAVWNVCDQGGNPVKSGVYYVLVSNYDRSGSGSSEGGHTKIMVIR